MAREIRIGMVRYGQMGRIHAYAYRSIPIFYDPLPFRLKLQAVADIVPGAADKAVRQAGFARASTDWRAVVADPEVDVVDTRALIVSPESATAATMALVGPSGERAFLSAFGGNGDLRAEEIDLAVCGSAGILHVGGVGLLPALDGEPLARVCQAAKARGMTVTLDTVWDPLGRWQGPLAALPYVDVFLPSREEAVHLFGVSEPEAIVRAARHAGARTVVIKLGAEGCYVDTGGSPVRFPALAGPVVDTTGAGDAFCAGFLAGLVQGWGAEAAARLGIAAGCLSVSRMGAVSGLRSLAETLEVSARGGLKEP